MGRGNAFRVVGVAGWELSRNVLWVGDCFKRFGACVAAASIVDIEGRVVLVSRVKSAEELSGGQVLLDCTSQENDSGAIAVYVSAPMARELEELVDVRLVFHNAVDVKEAVFVGVDSECVHGETDIAFGSVVCKGGKVCVESAFGTRFGTVYQVELPPDGQIGVIGPSTEIKVIQGDGVHTETSAFDKCKLLENLVSDVGIYMNDVCDALVSWICQCSNSMGPFGRGVLLHGPSGVGKSYLVERIVGYSGIDALYVSPQDLFRTQKGEGERFLSNMLLKRAPSVAKHSKTRTCLVVLDNIDIMAPRDSETDSCIGPVLLACLDRAFSSEDRDARVIVLGVSCNFDLLDTRVIHPKRLGSVVSINAPSGLVEREDLVSKLFLHHSGITLPPDTLERISRRGNGLVPAEFDAVVQDLCRRGDREWSDEQLAISFGSVFSSHLKDGMVSNVGKSLNSGEGEMGLVGGQQEAKLTLCSSVLLPLRSPEKLEAMGLDAAPRGILLHGPSGNGKTLLAQALADILDKEGLANMVTVQCQQLISKVVGETESNIISVFRRASAALPCVLFLDQIEAIAGRRGNDSSSEQTMDRMLSCLLTEMDGIQSKKKSKSCMMSLIILAATDSKQKLDPAILRPGRFDQHILVDNPRTVQDRIDVIRVALRKVPFATEDEREKTIDSIALHTSSESSCADITGHIRECVMSALRKDIQIRVLNQSHFVNFS